MVASRMASVRALISSCNFAFSSELPGDLEYHHFIEYIDSQFCEKYGFTKTLLSDTAEVRDGHALCVSRHEFTHLLAERRAERQEKAKLQEDIKARTDAMLIICPKHPMCD